MKISLLMLVFAFLYLRLSNEFSAIGNKIYEVHTGTLLLSLAFMLLYQVASIVLWQFLTTLYNQQLPFFLTASIWSFSVLGKYVPGKALLWGLRFTSYKKHHPAFRADSIVHCFLIEYLSNIIAGVILLLVSLTILPVKGFEGGMMVGSLMIFAVSLVAVHPRVLHSLTLQLMKRFGVSSAIERGVFRDTVKTIIFSLINWGILGLTIYVICIAVSPHTNGGGYFYVTTAYAFAGMAGFLAFFAPSGIGVREAILIEALSPQMPLEDAALVAALARLVSTIGELGSAALFSLIVSVANPLRRTLVTKKL